MLRRRRRHLRYRDQSGARIFRNSVQEAESRGHLEIRTALYDSISLAFSDTAAVGSRQSVFWNAASPDRVIAPDLFVRVGVKNFLFDSWKTWEWGAPHVVAVIADDENATELEWSASLGKFDEMGVEELVRFDPISPTDTLRVWDRMRGALRERELEHTRHAYSPTFDAHWIVVRMEGLGRVLRIARDIEGPELYPTRLEYEVARRSLLEHEVERLRNESARNHSQRDKAEERHSNFPDGEDEIVTGLKKPLSRGD